MPKKLGKKKKLVAGKAQATTTKKGRHGHQVKDARDRRAHKLEHRKKEKKNYTANDWAVPAPSHLVAKLDLPKVKSKYQSYFEFADNPEKQKKKLEFTVVDDAKPPPGFMFVPIGDPILTNKCKDLSREREAMIFIVSTWKEENSKISEHVHRTGYHFRESIVEEAREIIGETVISKPNTRPGFIEPIPESQDEINKQADAAIRDLFPRIPNTDRTMIIEHAFKKGALFHGEPTVGLQSNIPLSRRVQLAVLAHIRHTHTRYDKLLRETSWMNARKAVEPVCLDVLVRWRGDEETGRDQMDEILREVVIITDSEGESDSSDEDDSSDDDGEVTSASSTEAPSLPVSRNQQRPMAHSAQAVPTTGSNSGQAHSREKNAISSRTRSQVDPNLARENKAQRGFKRYQAAWEDAVHRRQERPASGPNFASRPVGDPALNPARIAVHSPIHTTPHYPSHQYAATRPSIPSYHSGREENREYTQPRNVVRNVPYYSQQGSISISSLPRDEVIVRSHTDRPVYHEEIPTRFGTPSHILREQRPAQVVRGSPIKRGPEDMPLPSIESASSNVITPRKDERHNTYEDFNHPLDVYPRRLIEPRLQTPTAREVIVINDDSPPVKRRRVVYEDNSGYFRPVSSRDHGTQFSAPLSASHLMLAPSQAEDYLVRRPVASSHYAQGSVRRQPEFYTDPVTSERLPIYDAPPVYPAQRSEHAGRLDVEQATTVRRVEDRIDRPRHLPASRDNINVDHTLSSMQSRGERFQEVDHEHSRHVQSYNHGNRAIKAFSPQNSVSQQSRSYDGLSGSNGPDQDFIHSFSQSRLEGASSQARNGPTVFTERLQQNPHPNNLRHNERSDRSVMSSTRANSPPRYKQRSMQDIEGHRRQPVYESITSLQSRPIPIQQPARMERDHYSQMPANPRYNRTPEQRQPIYIVD